MTLIRTSAGSATPWWPEPRPAIAMPPARYDREADELVVRFHEWNTTPVATAFLARPEHDYVGVIEEIETGRIVGIQIDGLADAGSRDHPDWASLAHPNPPAAAVAALVADVRALFDRYGVDVGAPGKDD